MKNKTTRTGGGWLLVAAFLMGSCSQGVPSRSKPVRAADALATFQVADGFKIEMIAAEPLVTDPVDMEIDEYGRMYVVEMHGYPLDKSGTGKIILLTDENEDGIMDQRIVFKEDLVLPTSVMRWKKGILVTDAPNLLYLEDTDNDGRADITDTVMTGFALSNPQHNLNSPVYGIDNWIYLAHEGAVSTREYKEEFGDEGTEVYYPGKPDGPKLPRNANGRSLRLKPDSGLVEMGSSRSQFGHTFDQWGHLFACNNSDQGYHEVIAGRYFQRNKNLTASDAIHHMSDHQNAAEVFPTTIHPDRQLLTNVGVMTSACGLTSYQGGLFPAPYDQNITFIAEPVSNLVHVDILKDSGASFTASRILQNKEFFSSSDAWSRPVNMYTGPDGALYILDYYRLVIESPEWMSEEAIAAGGLYDGMDMGRIYRITPAQTPAAAWTKGLRLGDASSEELVKQLENKNNWWRINAQRLLVDRAEKAAIPALHEMARNSDFSLARLHALWTLEGMGALPENLIVAGLRDDEAGVRENAVKLAELHLSHYSNLDKELMRLKDDPNEKVRFQLLLTLGYIDTPESIRIRNELLFRDISDKWMQIAALSASASHSAELLKLVLDRYNNGVDAYASLVKRLTAMIGTGGNIQEIAPLIVKGTATGNKSAWKAPLLEGLATGMLSVKEKQILPIDLQHKLTDAFFASDDQVQYAAFSLLKVNGITNDQLRNSAVQKAVALMMDTTMSDKRRANAVDFLVLSDPGQYTNQLKKLITPHEQPLVQLAAVRTLGQVKGVAITEYLIQQWPALTKDIREAAIGVLIETPERTNLLLTAIENDKIKSSSVSFPRSVRLMQNADSSLRSRARVIFTKDAKEAKKINEEYQAALRLDGDPVKGKQVYTQNCALCHQVRGKSGVAFGPDLGTIHNWTKEDIMANILDPSLSISSGFDLWDVHLNNGENIQGVIVAETPSAITLRNNGQADRIVNRQDIQSLSAMSISAMPSGLQKNIDQQQMADLLSFLRQN